MTIEESVCAAIVCDVLGAQWRRIQHSHDFDIVFTNRTDYLEVSAFTYEDVERRWRQTPAPRPTSLNSTWTLHVTGHADLRTVQADAEPHLETLERHGLKQYSAGDQYELRVRYEPEADPDDPPSHPVALASDALVALGVEDATVLSAMPPTIEVAANVVTTGSPTQLVNTAAAAVAGKPDNIAKLTSSVATTHLFIPVRMAGGGVRSAAGQGAPIESPSIHPAIGRVWLLGQGSRVLTLDQGGGWNEHSFSQRVFMHPDAWRVP